MEKNFNFKIAENDIYKKWIENNMFKTSVNKEKKPFTIIMPPPNVTSRLHIGHALDLTIQDAIIRFKRMQGFEALFLPGADHAAIATEAKVTAELLKQGIDKSKLTREEFMVHVNQWYEIYTEQIISQMKRLGLSADWSKFQFTLGERSLHAVRTVFDNLFKKGLIYKGERMVNWCTNCATAISDDEVEHESCPQPLYSIRFPSKDNGTGIVIATVRPEAIFSAVAIAVHPDDKRYKNIVGKKVSIPLINIEIPVIADTSAEMKFGTGAVQMTAHSVQSHEFCTRHNLKATPVIDKQGKMFGERSGEFAGLSVPLAREAVAKKLEQAGFLVSQKQHTSNVGSCYRCKTGIEPYMSEQWFLAMKDLAKPAIDVVESGELKIIPKKFEKTYMHWLRNIKDWCISRQLLSGIRIPIEGETDVLDTWFSSALWPFSTLGWPSGSDEFNYFYPTQVMVTGYDIIFWWIIRMVFSGIEHTKQLPFNTVLLHGLVRDKDGRKMAKSLGNGIDPLDVIEEFGADALRFSLISGTKLDRDPRYSTEKAILARNFINKIWNATKFYKMFRDTRPELFVEPKVQTLSVHDKWILTKLNSVIKSVTKKYEKFDFGVAATDLQTFFWHDFCDWYLEAMKINPTYTGLKTFRHVLIAFLKLINPIMPFVTEEIYCSVLKEGNTLLFQEFPKVDKQIFVKEKKFFDDVINLIESLRLLRVEGIGSAELEPKVSVLDDQVGIIEKLAGVSVKLGQVQNPEFTTRIAAVKVHSDEAEAKRKRDEKIKYLRKEIERGEKMLGNPAFVAKAPKELVKTETEKLAENKALLSQLAGG